MFLFTPPAPSGRLFSQDPLSMGLWYEPGPATHLLFLSTRSLSLSLSLLGITLPPHRCLNLLSHFLSLLDALSTISLPISTYPLTLSASPSSHAPPFLSPSSLYLLSLSVYPSLPSFISLSLSPKYIQSNFLFVLAVYLFKLHSFSISLAALNSLPLCLPYPSISLSPPPSPLSLPSSFVSSS